MGPGGVARRRGGGRRLLRRGGRGVERGLAGLQLDLVLPSALEVVGGALELGEALPDGAAYLGQLARAEYDERDDRYHEQLGRPQKFENE